MRPIIELVQGDTEKITAHLKKTMGKDYFDFRLLYCDSNQSPETFKEIDRFNDESKVPGTFKNEYEGDAVVEITDWVENGMNLYFEAFTYFLLDRMIKYPNSKLVLTSEKICTQDFLSGLDKFFSKVVITDLGVKVKKAEKKVIGFAVEEMHEEPTEFKKEVRQYV